MPSLRLQILENHQHAGRRFVEPYKGSTMIRTTTLALALVAVTHTVGRGDYTAIDLVQTYGFQTSIFNSSGQFAGTQNFGSGSHAFLFTVPNTVTDLGTLGGVTSSASAISANGFVAGQSQINSTSVQHAFLWQPGVGMTDLGTLGGNNSFGTGVNSSAAVAGRSQIAGGLQHAFYWQPGVGLTDIGTLGGNSSQALALTDGGRVVGSGTLPNGDTHPFLWTSAAGILDLGTLGGSVGTARAANDNGLVVGQARRSDNSNGAFLWTAASGMSDLGTLGGITAGATGVNSQNQIVGFSDTATEEQHAFLWDAVHGLRDLNDLINGYSLTSALAINDQGQIIAAGLNNDGPTLYLLTPTDAPVETPAPPGVVLAGLAIVSGLAVRARSRWLRR